MSLQAITLAQPWPRMMLLDENPKRVENREWEAPRKLVGSYLAFHGGRLPKAPKELREVRAAMDWVNDRVWGGEEDPTDWLSDEDMTGLCVSGIYGVARLAGVVTSSEDPWFVGPFGWVLEDFTAITPVPCKGKQGLWTVEGDLLATVRQRWAAARRQQQDTSPPPFSEPAEVTEMSEAPATPAAPVAVDPGAHLRIPGLFCPGLAVGELPRELEPGRLYGLPVGGDWVTVSLGREDGYVWCSRRTSGVGQGSRKQLLAWMERLRAGVAA